MALTLFLYITYRENSFYDLTYAKFIFNVITCMNYPFF